MNKSITETLRSFIEFEEKPHHRFRSWHHCYNYFQNEYFKGLCNDQTAALHLGFYLASWGMYRGSTFLIQNDYTIHIGIVQILLDNKDLDFSNYSNIEKVKQKIIDHYKDSNKSTLKSNAATDTLVTKILLGTYACTPAYDDFFKRGLRKLAKNNGFVKKFGVKSLKTLNKFYEKNKEEFKPFEEKYPKMKLLDMYFWKLGFDNE